MKNYPVTAELRTCLSCGFRKVVSALNCPRCGRPIFTKDGVRKKGVLSLIFGLLWVFAVLGLTAFIVFIVAGLAVRAKSREEAESQNMTLFIMLFISGIFLSLGFSFIFSGIWQIIFAKPNHLILWLTIIFVVIGQILIFFM